MVTLPAAMTHGNGSNLQRRGWAGLATSLLSDLFPTATTIPLMAQGAAAKLGNLSPLGHGDTPNGNCSTLGLISYSVTPTHGKVCLSGWLNIGGRSCRRT